MVLPSADVTQAWAKISNWSGCRCRASQTRKAASATGSVVPWAKASFASVKRLTASQHRQAAFQAAEFLMDYLKTSAPFWKKEESATGTGWVEAHARDDEAAARWTRS